MEIGTLIQRLCDDVAYLAERARKEDAEIAAGKARIAQAQADLDLLTLDEYKAKWGHRAGADLIDHVYASRAEERAEEDRRAV